MEPVYRKQWNHFLHLTDALIPLQTEVFKILGVFLLCFYGVSDSKGESQGKKIFKWVIPKGVVWVGGGGRDTRNSWGLFFLYLSCFPVLATGYSWKATARTLMIDAKLLDYNPRSCCIKELGLISQQSYQTEHDFCNPLKFSPENKSLMCVYWKDGRLKCLQGPGRLQNCLLWQMGDPRPHQRNSAGPPIAPLCPRGMWVQ